MNEIDNTKQEVEKIVVHTDNELLDVIRKIQKSSANKVILTFAEQSDILISPINFKVIQETADENRIPLVVQIVQNPAGVRNAKDANMVVTETTGALQEELWEQAQEAMRIRLKDKENSFRKKKDIKQEEVTNTVDEDTFIEEKKEIVKEEIVEIEEEPIKEKSEFEKRIEETLQKAKERAEQRNPKVIEENGIEIMLDDDIAQRKTIPETKIDTPSSISFVGRDMFSFKQNVKEEVVEEPTHIPKPRQIKTENIFSNILTKLKGVKFNNSLIIKLLIPILATLIITSYLVLYFAPLVRVKAYVKSKEVSIEKVFTANTSTTDFDYINGLVPLRKEEIKKEASSSTTATGTAYKGTKAEGIVTLTYWEFLTNGGKSTTVPSGSIITASNGLKFETLSAVTVGTTTPLSMTADVGVRAVAVGQEYNLAGGSGQMTVTGYTADKMTGSNTAAFSGGAKEEYRVFSQEDMDSVVKELKKNISSDLKNELEIKTENGWEVIEKSLKEKETEKPSSDVPVGAEGNVVNITVKMTLTALLYNKQAVENSIGDVLTQEAQNQNLFNSEDGLKLQMDSDITKELTIDNIKEDSVKINLKASGRIKPELNKDNIINAVKGLSIQEGSTKLEQFKYTDKDIEVEYTPSFIPEFLRSYPNRQGRILITVVELQE